MVPVHHIVCYHVLSTSCFTCCFMFPACIYGCVYLYVPMYICTTCICICLCAGVYKHMCLHAHVCPEWMKHACICIYVYTYIYIGRERERERDLHSFHYWKVSTPLPFSTAQHCRPHIVQRNTSQRNQLRVVFRLSHVSIRICKTCIGTHLYIHIYMAICAHIDVYIYISHISNLIDIYIYMYT